MRCLSARDGIHAFANVFQEDGVPVHECRVPERSLICSTRLAAPRMTSHTKEGGRWHSHGVPPEAAPY